MSCSEVSNPVATSAAAAPPTIFQTRCPDDWLGSAALAPNLCWSLNLVSLILFSLIPISPTIRKLACHRLLTKSVEQLFGFALLRRLAEDIGVLSIDKTNDGVALKFSEKANISPQKLATFVNDREGRIFSPTGILRLPLGEEEHDHLLDTMRGTLTELRSNGGQ